MPLDRERFPSTVSGGKSGTRNTNISGIKTGKKTERE